MAQTGYTPIQLYYSTTASAVPTNTNLANGELAINITDGKLYYKDNTGTVKLLAGAGGAGIAGGSNTQVQYNSSGNLAGDADLTFDGTTLSTAGLTASGSVTLSGGTANGVTYLNGSKQLVSGSALTFDGTNLGVGIASATSLLDVRDGVGSILTLGNTGNFGLGEFSRIKWKEGSTQLADIGWEADTNELRINNRVAYTTFYASNAEALRLTSTSLYTASGINVGIGTSSPAGKLDIYQNSSRYVRAYPSSGLADFEVVTNNNVQPVFAVKGTGTADLIRAYAGATQAMTLDASGNLGVGTTSPSARFHSYAGATSQAGIFEANNSVALLSFVSNTTSSYTRVQLGAAGNDMVLYTTGTERARIDSSGNVGIGTSSPQAKLDVRDVNKIVDGIGNVFFATTDSQAVDKGATLSLGGSYVGSSVYSFAAIAGRKANSTSSDASGYLAMYTTNPSNTVVERARIDSSGNLLVGTTTSPSGSGKIVDQYGYLRAVPPVGTKTGSYTLAAADVGRYVQVSTGGAITIPDATFAEGDVVSVFNNTSGTITITCSITTAYIAGTYTDKATMTLAAAGVATVLFISGTLCVVSGNVT